MLALRTVDLRENMSEFLKKAYAGEKIIVTRPKAQNVAVVSEKRLKELEEKEKELAYILKIQKINDDIEKGINIISGKDLDLS